MRSTLIRLAALVVLLAPGASFGADGPDGNVHRMEIINGGARSVAYFVPGSSSPGEAEAWAERQRTENEGYYARDLLQLKRQYVENERLLDAHRAYVQMQLYGRNETYSTALGGLGGVSPYYLGLSGYGGYGLGGYRGYAGYYGAYYPTGLYGGGWGGYGLGLGTGGTINRSLANGVGDEGAIKSAMAQTIASQATPQFAAAVQREGELALARVSSPERPVKGPPKGTGGIAEAAYETPANRPVKVLLRNGDRIEGTLLRENADWVTVKSGKEEIRVRTTEVTRMTLGE